MTMLEKMAEAFAAHVRANAHGDWIGGDARCLEVDGTIDLPDALRTALLAIREPDEAMVGAGTEAGDRAVAGADEWAAHDCNIHESQPPAMFTAMIDAILAEGTEAGA